MKPVTRGFVIGSRLKAKAGIAISSASRPVTPANRTHGLLQPRLAAEHEQERDGRVHPVAHGAAPDEAAEVLDPRDQGGQDQQHTRDHERPPEPVQLGAHEGQGRRGRQHDEPDVAAPVGEPLDHPFHRRASSERSVRNSASTMKLA